MEVLSTAFEYTWHVKNYNYLSPLVTSAESPPFEIPTLEKHVWCLGFYTDITNGNVSLFLKRCSTDSGIDVVSLKFNMSILNVDKTVANNQKAETFFFSKGSSRVFQFQLQTPNPSNTLILRCKFYAAKTDGTFNCLGNKDDLMALSNDITSLLKNEVHSDVILTQYGKSFKAHKAILWARYQELLQLEGPAKDTEIHLLPNDLKALLRDIYSGHLDSFESDTLLCAAVRKQELNLRGNVVSQSSLCVHSVVRTQSVCHEWSINIKELIKSKKMNSPLLRINGGKLSLWKIIINLSNKYNAESVDIYLKCLFKKLTNPLYINYEISSSGKIYTSAFHLFHDGESYLLPIKLGLASFIENSEKRGSILLKCVLSISDDTITSTIHEAKTQYKEADYENLSNDLRKLHKNQQFSDVTLAVGGKAYPAHKAILSARSLVFSRMFQANMSECIDNRVVITDIDPEIIESLLEFMYAGMIRVKSTGMVQLLYAAADKYEVLTLKRGCYSYLKSKLSLENVIENLILADTHQDLEFKKVSQNLIYENVDRIFLTAEWKNLIEKRIELASEIIQHLSIEHGEKKKSVKKSESSSNAPFEDSALREKHTLCFMAPVGGYHIDDFGA